MILLADANEEDKALRDVLAQLFAETNNNKIMFALTDAQLKNAIDEAGVQSAHPIGVLPTETELEEAATGIQESNLKLYTASLQGTISSQDLLEADDRVRRIGGIGKEFVCEYLQHMQDSGAIRDFEWVSRWNAISPYDFRVTANDGSTIYVDAKSTSDSFDRPIHISFNELLQMNSESGRYDLYRVFQMEDETAKISIAENLRQFAGDVLAVIQTVPHGVTVDGISVRPSSITATWHRVEVRLDNSSGEDLG